MTPNRTYQATVEALESVLAPRVVSLVLREGLAQSGRDANSIALEDVEAILTGPAFRHLQVLMPGDQARETVTAFLNRIREEVEGPAEGAEDEAADAPGEGEPEADGVAGSASKGESTKAQRLRSLRAALRPFNLYFDWPEVRKLRAQLQVAEDELDSKGSDEASLDEAAAQLEVVEQKLEDSLVLQARELAELEEALELVQSLGGPRVRRLEALVGQVRQAQRDRELAEAEVQRAATIARDLRKLMESSVAQAAPYEAAGASTAPAPDEEGESDQELTPVDIDESLLPPEVSERLKRLDLDAERKQVEALESAHTELLSYLPALRERIQRARAQLDEGRPLGAALTRLSRGLDEATNTQRDHLRRELEALAEGLDELRAHDDGGLERAVRVTLDVLGEGLPRHADVLELRDRQRRAIERAEEHGRREADARARESARLETQREALQRIEEALERDEGTDDATLEALSVTLRQARQRLHDAVSQERLDDTALEQALDAEQAFQRALAARTDDEEARLRARLRELSGRLRELPDVPTLRSRVAHLGAELERTAGSDDLDESHVGTLASLVEQLRADALAHVARQLDELGKEAGDLSVPSVLTALQEAARGLQGERFPDVDRLRDLLADERKQRREREQARAQRLQQARARLEPAGVAALPAFTQALERARRVLSEGRSAATELDAAERELGTVEAQIQARVEGFGPRLDAALETFSRVKRLNNDEVAAVSRVLTHLDTQREALARISPGLQHQLERSLSEAERLLAGLSDAYETTRAVADQLVAGKVIDDVLDWFDDLTGRDPGGAEAPSAAEESAPPDGAALEALLAPFRELEDVDAAAVVGADGTVFAGDLARLEGGALAPALANAARAWDSLAGALDDGSPTLVGLALGSRYALVAPVGRDAHALLVVRSGGAISALTTRFRDRLRELAGASDPSP